jgi:tetratricopeptide (TPR) repeat protein
VSLLAGGVNVLPAKGYLTLDAMGFILKTNGYLRLRQCVDTCKEPLGLYGKTLSGEVIVEYAGGRSVLRNKPFRAALGGARPVILARESDLLTEDNQLELAAKAKVALAEEIKVGMDAYKNGQFDKAREVLMSVREKSPTEKIVAYYLGLTALELKDNDAALNYLQQYARDDPDTARERGVNQLVTLLLTKQLQDEVKQALQQENKLTQDKPEPNTIAVQAFTNRGDPAYAALAKGIAAMVITDLSKIPGLKVLERQKVQKLMDEISLSESGLVSQDNLVKAGRLMRAEKVVVGSFGVQ